MQLIYDNLVAIIIGTTVILIVSFLQVRSTRNSVEQVATHAAKTKALTFGEWLEDDIVSLGKNVSRDHGRFELPDTLADGNTGFWMFYSDSLLANGNIERHMTRYRLEERGTRDLGDETLNLYQAYRETADTPVVAGLPLPVTEAEWQEDGRSVATLSFFDIRLLLGNGEETTNTEAADFIRIRFAMVPEFEVRNGDGLNTNFLNEYYWTTTLKVRPFWETADDEA